MRSAPAIFCVVEVEVEVDQEGDRKGGLEWSTKQRGTSNSERRWCGSEVTVGGNGYQATSQFPKKEAINGPNGP